jgi:hypothetical protein
VAAVILSGFGSSSNFQQEGFFKDQKKNRIETFVFGRNENSDSVRKHGERQIFTQGQLLAIYYYPQGSIVPGDKLTLADGVFKANDVVFSRAYSRPRYSFVRELTGSAITFVDCLKTPKHGLCKAD